MSGQTATIDLDQGETVTCTYTNTLQSGSITIVKDVDPEPDGEDFEFSTVGLGANFLLDDDDTATLSNTKTYLDVNPGAYSVTELAEAGYDLTDVTCVGDDTADTDDSATALIDLDPGENVTCTFSNEKDASITIVKDVDPEPDGEDFEFSTVGLGADFSLDDDDTATLSNTKTYSDVNPGAYSVTELAEAGYDLTDVTCVGDDTADTDDSATALIDLDPGENVTCTFSNEKDASITIVKDVDPEPDGEDFEFSTVGLGANFLLDDDDNATLSNTKTYLRRRPRRLLGHRARRGRLRPDRRHLRRRRHRRHRRQRDRPHRPRPGRERDLHLHQREGRLDHDRQGRRPRADGEDFEFSTVGLGANFLLDDDANATLSNTKTYLDVDPGAYSVTELAEAGYDLTDVDLRR